MDIQVGQIYRDCDGCYREIVNILDDKHFTTQVLGSSNFHIWSMDDYDILCWKPVSPKFKLGDEVRVHDASGYFVGYGKIIEILKFNTEEKTYYYRLFMRSPGGVYRSPEQLLSLREVKLSNLKVGSIVQYADRMTVVTNIANDKESMVSLLDINECCKGSQMHIAYKFLVNNPSFKIFSLDNGYLLKEEKQNES